MSLCLNQYIHMNNIIKNVQLPISCLYVFLICGPVRCPGHTHLLSNKLLFLWGWDGDGGCCSSLLVYCFVFVCTHLAMLRKYDTVKPV